MALNLQSVIIKGPGGIPQSPHPVISVDTNGNYISTAGNGTTAIDPSSVFRLVQSANSTNTTLIKNSPGKVFTITGRNTTVLVRYLKFYNTSTSPTAGVGTPLAAYALPANSHFAFELRLPFTTGIGFTITSGNLDSDSDAVPLAGIEQLQITYA